MSAPEVRTPPIDVGLLSAFYFLEAAGSLLAMALYRYSERLDSLTVRQWTWILAPLAALLASGAYVSHCYLRSRHAGSKRFNFTLATNLLAVAILFVAGEIVVRGFAVPAPLGFSFAKTLLLPRSWEHLRARKAQLLKNGPSDISYLVRCSLLC